MAKFGCLAVGFLIASGSWSCLLYTDHINRPPEVKVMGNSEVTWGSRPSYHADARDPDQSPESLSYEWRQQKGACPAAGAAANTGTLVGFPSADYEVENGVTEPFCVWVIVRDNDKASATAALAAQVVHQKTVATIDVIKPKPAEGDRYPLFSAVRLTGANSQDPENGKLTFRWAVTRAGAPVDAPACPDAPDTDICFTVEQPGEYTVTLTVKDQRDVETVKIRKLTIDPDAPPCIRRTEPGLLGKIVRSASDDLPFEVKSVEDDGDPFPALEGRPSTYTFTATWWLEGEDSNNPSGRRPADQGQIPLLTFSPNYFRNGDQAYVRIQVSDRVNRDFSACIRDKVDNCALGKDLTCFQWVTWKIDFRLGRDM